MMASQVMSIIIIIIIIERHDSRLVDVIGQSERVDQAVEVLAEWIRGTIKANVHVTGHHNEF
jgi:hypothetical protein